MTEHLVQVGREAADHLRSVCEQQLAARGMQALKERLELELREVFAQNEQEYLAAVASTGQKYHNEHNLLVSHLLDICPDFDPSKPPAWHYGENPDVDIDYVPPVRNYLKDEFSPKKYGDEYVCNIAAYSTFGLRSALLDMARVHGLDHNEIQRITKQLAVKDEDGKDMTWEAALDLYKDLRDYCAEHQEMAKAAKHIINRNRSMTQHASGLIISGKALRDFVPIVRGKDGAPASAWVEGLHGTDLGAVGLVKFDFLSLDGNVKIAYACHLAKQRKNLSGISALPGKDDWTDTAYLNDPKALKMAAQGDLKLVFQFDGSEGIRRLARQADVSSFDDLAALTALYRPGPMQCLEKGTSIRTSTGSKPIESLQRDDSIGYLSSSGQTKFTTNYVVASAGTKKLLKITVKSGKSIICSKDHRLLRGDKKFVEAKFLQRGEKLLLNANSTLQGSEQPRGLNEVLDMQQRTIHDALQTPKLLAQNNNIELPGSVSPAESRTRGVEKTVLEQREDKRK